MSAIDGRTALRWYLLGVRASGVPERVAESLTDFAEQIAREDVARLRAHQPELTPDLNLGCSCGFRPQGWHSFYRHIR